MLSALLHAFRFPAVALHHRDVLSSFVRRDLKARYEGSLLGRIWPVFQPLLLLAVYSLVFSGMMDMSFVRPNFRSMVGGPFVTTFFMLSGILAWTCTVEAVNRSCGVILENANLIKKVAFPSELLPTYTVMVSFVQMLIGFAIFAIFYAAVMLSVGEGTPAENAAGLVNLAWLPVPIVLHFLFVTGLGMLLAALNVFARDLQQVVPLATLVWMFFTPIFYRIESLQHAVEKSGATWIISAAKWNPLYHLMALYRGCFTYEQGVDFPVDSLGIFAAIAVGVFVLGFGCFRRWKGLFPDEV